jgi:hypothetical protein
MARLHEPGEVEDDITTLDRCGERARIGERAGSELDAEARERIHTDAKIEVATAIARAKALPDAGPAELGPDEVYA